MRWRNNTLSYAMSCNSSSAHCWFKQLIKTTVISWWATFHVCDNKRLPICHIQHLDFWSKPRLDLKLKLLQWFGLQYCNGPPCAGHFYALAFDSPLGNSKVTGSRWTYSSTYTLWWSTRLSFKKKLSTHCRLKCSQLFPIPVKFVQWPKSTWLCFQMASSHPAAHYWTTGCFKDRKSWIKTLYHLLPMKYWFCSLRAFNWCLGDIYFSEDGSGGHIVSLLHLLGCNNSMWISKLLGEVDVLVSVIQWTTCPSNLITPQCLC